MLIYVRIVPALDTRRICFLTAMGARISTCSSGMHGPCMRVSIHSTAGIINTCGDPRRNKKSVDGARDADAFSRRRAGIDTGHECEREKERERRTARRGKRMDVERGGKVDRKNIRVGGWLVGREERK